MSRVHHATQALDVPSPVSLLTVCTAIISSSNRTMNFAAHDFDVAQSRSSSLLDS